MMVAGAKADLLRRGDYIQEQSNPHSTKGHFPGGWVRKDTAAASPTISAMGPAPAVGSLAQAAPFRERSSSYNSFPSLQRSRSREAAPTHTSIPSRVYEPPQPSYSVSSADPIPRGYVAHAQEACVKVDFQWDSMRAPQNWGDGGEYGDEWSTMHKRFRKGLAGMMQWYRMHGTAPPKESFPGFLFKEPLRLTPPPAPQTQPEPFPSFSDGTAAEEDEELVIVLVTHGAGCNALLGAIQNQPVLMDIGLASLSMAVRRDEPIKPAAPTIHERRLSVADPGMSDTYEMKLLASVDHLRPGVDPSKPPSTQSRMQSPVVTASPSLDHRRRFTGSFTSNSPLESPFSLGEPHRTLSSSLSGLGRTMSSGSNSRFIRHSTSGAASPAGGLWSGTQTPAVESPSVDSVPSFVNQHPSPKTRPSTFSIPIPESALETTNGLTKMDSKEEREVGDKFTPLVSAQSRAKTGSSAGLWGAKVAPKTNTGLWGPPKLDDVYEHSHGHKRRWTVTERGDGM
jgi:hypothetical protein